MSEWRLDLANKISLMKNLYEEILVNKCYQFPSSSVFTEEDTKLYLSMKRWHKNMHLDSVFLKEQFRLIDVESNLNTKEGMTPIPSTLSTFLKKKFKSVNPKHSFSIHDMFGSILDDILSSYKSKLCNRECEDYDVVQLFCTIPPPDLYFYTKTYSPAAVYYTYKSFHHEFLEEEELMDDIFSIGAGSRTCNLIPELTVYCEECCGSLSSDDAENINLCLFNYLRSSHFIIPNCGLSSNNEEENIEDQFSGIREPPISPAMEDSSNTAVPATFTCKKCKKEFSEQSYLTYHTEIFHKDDQSSIFGSEKKEANSFVCHVCEKKFSTAEFLDYHGALFHKKNKCLRNNNTNSEISSKVEEGAKKRPVVKPVYVEDAEILITTFNDEDRLRTSREAIIPRYAEAEEMITSFVIDKSKRNTKRRLKFK